MFYLIDYHSSHSPVPLEQSRAGCCSQTYCCDGPRWHQHSVLEHRTRPRATRCTEDGLLLHLGGVKIIVSLNEGGRETKITNIDGFLAYDLRSCMTHLSLFNIYADTARPYVACNQVQCRGDMTMVLQPEDKLQELQSSRVWFSMVQPAGCLHDASTLDGGQQTTV